MIDGLRPYPAVKDSGVQWLGQVPKHWLLRRMKTVMRQRAEKGFPDEPLLAATQSKGVVRKEQYENRTVLALKDLHLLKRVRRGDFVISLRSFQGGIEYAREQGIISPAYTVLYPASPDSHGFLAWLFKSKPFVGNLSLYVTGIRQGQNIDYEKLSRSDIPLPPLAEQAAIVRFLDYADRRIRRYIRAKQKLLKLLEEQKQALIHLAVTRGLDPNVRLKSSGVEWLGDVPEHWQLWRLRSLAHIKTGDRDTAHRVDSGQYPFFVRSQTVERINSWAFDGEAVLTAGDGAGVAKVFHYVKGKFDYHQRVYKLSGFREILGRFFFEYFRATLKFEALAGNAKSTVDSLRLPMLQNFPVLVPPKSEQAAIVASITEATGSIDSVIECTRLELSLLREFRTRLIADVVTGKVDVREAASRLPEEAEEIELLEEADDTDECEDQSADEAELEEVEV